MEQDHLKIALTFSGGGYRAAAFHLGVLSYLDMVKVGNGSSLLNHVVALSTISGGTIPGLRYMLGLSRGESTSEIFKALYSFFTDVDLATITMQNLSSYKDGESASVIRTMADIYNEKLFQGARFGKLMDDVKKNHISQFSANATDFTNGLPFRFQATTGKQDKDSGYGIIGNNKIRVLRTVARHIRLSEILACSSCFPSGFEPVMFPQDFEMGESQEVKEYKAKTEPFGIMDGGIVDNQGIEPVLLAEQRMKGNYPGKEDKCLDMLIICDVSSPYMDAYKPSSFKLPGWLDKLSLRKLSSWLWIGSGIMTLLTVASLIWQPNSFLSGFLAFIWLVIVALLIASVVLKKKLLKIAEKTIIKSSISAILNLTFGDIATLAANRISSVLMLVSSVFMKHLRRMNYRSAYTDPAWMNRCVMNGIYELRPGESWEANLKSKHLPAYLKPSELIQQNSIKAASMGTTLWFTEDEIASGMHDAIIATGQYTMCFNLLQYIEVIKKDKRNTTEAHQAILSCEDQLKAHWEEFQKNPLLKVAFFLESNPLSAVGNINDAAFRVTQFP